MKSLYMLTKNIIYVIIKRFMMGIRGKIIVEGGNHET